MRVGGVMRSPISSSIRGRGWPAQPVADELDPAQDEERHAQAGDRRDEDVARPVRADIDAQKAQKGSAAQALSSLLLRLLCRFVAISVAVFAISVTEK